MKRIALITSALAILVACGSEDHDRDAGPGEEPEPPASAVQEATSEADGSSADRAGARLARLGDFRTAAAVGNGDFRHDPHATIECTTCHPTPRGHATHGMVRCAECHDAPAGMASEGVPGPTECMGCHHERLEGRPCAACHDPAATLPALPVTVEIGVSGANDDPVRDLVFRHALHAGPACTDCHTGGAAFTVERSCASCHERHHRADADCRTCHAPLPLSTHDREVHDGCSGTACHTDPTVLSLPAGRSVCLACHQELGDHMEGGDCAACHQVGGGA